jgi:diguanylate cyclase (GGDEF)-like protein/PAS domain S-box-containing protein
MPATRVGRQPKAGVEGLARLETELRRANRTSAETLMLLETLLSKAPVGFGFVDRDFRMLRLNETLAALNGSTVAAQLGHTVAELVPELWPQLEPLYRHVLESGESVRDVRVDVPSPADPSATFQRTASYYPVSVADEVIGIGIVVVDITERTKAEQAVHFQADLLAAAGQAMVASDLAGVVVYWNRAAQELYGWSADDAIGRRISDLIGAEETRAEGDAILEGLHRGESWSGDLWVKHRDGTRFPVYVTDSPVFDHDAQLVAIIAVSVDLTERLAGEEARRQLVAIVDGSGDAIFAVANDGLVTAWNAAAERLFGYTAEEIVGHSIAALTPPEKDAEQREVRARVTAGGPAERLETTRCRKDGTMVEVLLTVSRLADKAGTPLGLSVVSHDITERRSAQQDLQTSLRQLADAQRVAHYGSAESNLVTGEITRSDEYCRILGVDPGVDLSSDQVVSMIHPDDRPPIAEAWEKAFKRGVPFDAACRIVRPDGGQRRVRFNIAPDVDDDGNVVKVVATLLDETERVTAEREQRSAEARFEVGFEQGGIGAVIVDLQGVPQRVNAAVESLLGRPAEELVGHVWVEYTHPDEIPLGQVVLARVAEGHDTYADERRYVRPNGEVVWASCHVTLVRDGSGQPEYFFAQLQDITERMRMEDALSQQALHDTLTGLPNRALITDRLFHNLAGVRRRNTHLGVVFLNIDHFQYINESLGYEAGDEVLRHVAELFSSAIRPGDSVARFGGDEFVVVCDNVTILEVERIAERILEAVSQPFLIGDQPLKANASLGIALADRNATPESLLRDSAAAMHRAKQRGRSRIELFDATLRSTAERRFATGTALRQALERGEFLVYYQPVVDLTTGAMVDAEALVRWQHPQRGLLLPAEFIPVAEEIGVIVPIGAFVLEQACQQLVEWQRTDPTMTVSVNLSVRQMLVPDFAGVVRDVLKSTGAPPGSLCLELTESVFMDDVEYFGATLAAFKALGVRLSIDDFGTGYSSLSYLKQFPVDAVKVDRAFVDGLGADTNDTALVAAIIAMAAALGLEVTAEGVETHDQLINLKRLRCQRAQGFYLARPMPPAAVTQLITEGRRWQVE